MPKLNREKIEMKPKFKHLLNRKNATVEHHVNDEKIMEYAIDSDDRDDLDLMNEEFERIYMHGYNLRRKEYLELKKRYTDEINDMSETA